MRAGFTAVAIVLVTVSFFGADAAAQSRFLEQGQGGIGQYVAYGLGEDYTQIGLGFTYTVKGRLDFLLRLARAMYDQEDFGEDFSSTLFSPGISYAIVRPSSVSKIGVELGADYTRGSFSGEVLDLIRWDMSSKGYRVGMEMYLRLDASPRLQVLPAAGVAYAGATVTIEDDDGNRSDSEVDDALYSVNVSLLINRKVFITPAYASFDGDGTWSVTAGFVFSIN